MERTITAYRIIAVAKRWETWIVSGAALYFLIHVGYWAARGFAVVR